ncbi:MAG TPA: acetate/propionate family kinase [Polyangiaceae bacterium]|nr:acetate/propionate family kinase [Polyangiaceae bacterium]
MSDVVLALNAGSSTLKYALYRCENGAEHELTSATLPMHGSASAAVLDALLARLPAPEMATITRVGHRLVHGGEHTAPLAVDRATLARLHALAPLAPLHLPPALELLEAALQRLPAALHVACFDTAFHRDLPEVARRLSLPLELHERGIRRYGFHGLSYQYVLSVLGEPAPARLVIAHLGSGASLAAVLRGRCIDTSMGFTPSGGIPMGTRSGDLDPGVLLYLQRTQGWSREQLEQLVDHEAGLLGVGGSADMQDLLAREAAGDARAKLAVAWFAYALKKQIGAYVAALGGLDCLVFTGGIGEHAARVRELCCNNLAVLGIELDAEQNASNAPLIGRPGAACQVRVIATDEDRMICRATLALARSVQA